MTDTIESNNKRILKNSLLLYVRMLLTMAIGFFTTRVVLQTLGEVDFGLYNVVGGVVSMLAFVQSAMSNSTSRFITYAIGLNDNNEIQKTFQTTLTIHLLIGIIVLLILETVGISIFYTMNIPDNRMNICMIIFQYSVLSIILSICTTPYHALIIAYEKISVYAYISILDVFLKLLIIYTLIFIDYDKLLVYGTLIFTTNIVTVLINVIYCNVKFKILKFGILFSSDRIKQVAQFSGWSFIGNFANILRLQGLNYLLNIFCGPSVNAARGIAVQVQSIVSRFILNIQVAINPQITKSYARGDFEYLKILVHSSSKYSFFVLFLISFPFFVEADYYLHLWLGSYPNYTVSFVKILLVSTILESLINPLEIAANATSKIKTTQIFVSFSYVVLFILCYIILKLGVSPNWTFVLNIIINVVIVLGRIRILQQYIQMSTNDYLATVGTKIFFILFPSISLYLIYYYITTYNNPLINSSVAIIIAFLGIFIFGLSNKERSFIINKVTNSLRIKK